MIDESVNASRLVSKLNHAKRFASEVLDDWPPDADGSLDLEQAITYMGRCAEWILEASGREGEAK